ncbi:MAG: hypothetical protein GXP31_13420 [Kiritimatiellaeota bacterium]|nr:hypothetical protein [Kiritimatiellota bacterium]
MIGPRPPVWWQLENPDVPETRDGTAYVLSPIIQRDFGRLVTELVTVTRDLPNVLGYMVSAGGEQDSSFSGPTNDPACLGSFRAWLRRRYVSATALRRAWEDPRAQFATAVPPIRLPGNDFRRSHRDWAEFRTGWWVTYVDRVAEQLRPLAPRKLLLARFGWPVFQAENVFLARCADVDLLQCKDAVAAWEVDHPGKQLSRTQMYYGALRHSAGVVFPEMDIVHGRGYQAGDLARYVPLFARHAGGLWYYRGLMPGRKDFLDDLSRARREADRLIQGESGPARTGVFVSVAWADWISAQQDYTNEAALVGAAELLEDTQLRAAAVSEFTLADLFDADLTVVPYNPAISKDAETVLQAYVDFGGAVVMEANTGEFYLDGRRRRHSVLRFSPFRKTATVRTRGRVTFQLSGLGLSGELSVASPICERGTFSAEAAPVATCAESAIVRRGTVLYIPSRFFSAYSYDRDADKAAMRGLLRAFFGAVRPMQEKIARGALPESRAEARRTAAGRDLLRFAAQALSEKRYIRAAFLARLAACAAPGNTGKRIRGAGILLRQQAQWLRAVRRRIDRLRRALGARTGDGSQSVFKEADAALALTHEALQGEAARESALARVVAAHEACVAALLRLRNHSGGP